MVGLEKEEEPPEATNGLKESLSIEGKRRRSCGDAFNFDVNFLSLSVSSYPKFSRNRN